MKKLATVLLSTVLLSPFAYAADPIVGTYKGGEVKESQVMSQFKAALDGQPSLKGKDFSAIDKTAQEAMVRGYINGKLLDDAAKKEGIEDSKEFKDKISTLKEQLLRQEVVERHIKNAVTDAMVDAEYDKIVKETKGKQEVKASHILVATEEEAKDIKKKLSKGAKFTEMAKEFSKDEGSKVNGGLLGYYTKDQLVPEFSQKAFSMKNGEISDPVKTQYGWHIIKVEDKRAVKFLSKEDAKPALLNKLKTEAAEKYIVDLASKADVKVTLPGGDTKN